MIASLILCVPTIWEVFNDRKGDFNKSFDVLFRIVTMLLASWTVSENFGFNFFASLNLSLAIFFLFFDYVIAYVLIRNGTLEPPKGVKYHWFTYQAKSGVIDNLKFWKSLKPAIKLGIRIAYFTGALWVFLR